MTFPTTLSRRALCAGVLSAAAPSARASEPLHDITLAQDFDELWGTLRDHYCFFDEEAVVVA